MNSTLLLSRSAFFVGSPTLCSNYLWRNKFGGTTVSEARRLKELEAENARLKRMLAEAMLENEITKEALQKKW